MAQLAKHIQLKRSFKKGAYQECEEHNLDEEDKASNAQDNQQDEPTTSHILPDAMDLHFFAIGWTCMFLVFWILFEWSHGNLN